MDKHLRPGNLALGENNAILNVWHGKYSGNYNDIFSKGFFRAYYKLLNPGDIIVLAVQHSELDLVQFLVTENSSTPEDTIPKDDFIKVKLISTTAKEEAAGVDIKELKRQIKAELARAYGLKASEVQDGEQN